MGRVLLHLMEVGAEQHQGRRQGRTTPQLQASISVWVLFGSSIRRFIENPKVKKIVEIVLAVLLIATGITILL